MQILICFRFFAGNIGGTFRLVGSPSCFVFVVVVEVVETSEDLQDLGMKLRLG